MTMNLIAPVSVYAEVSATNQTEETITEQNDTTNSTEDQVSETTENTQEQETEPSTTPTVPKGNENSKKEEKTTNSSAKKVPVLSVQPEKPSSWTSEPELEQTKQNEYPIYFEFNQTTAEFIQKIGADARKIAHENNLYASIMIAQAILESSSGNSGLATAPNYNLFGIKGEYRGSSVTMTTQEDDGTGKLYTIASSFRKYPFYKESLEDYAELLRKGLSGDSNFYRGVWKTESQTYQEATKSLTGKYATDTQYDEKLNKLIEVYSLVEYDLLKDEGQTQEQPKKETPIVKTTDKVELLDLYPNVLMG